MTVYLKNTEPCPVDKRPDDYFCVGDRVVCFVGEADTILPHKTFTYTHGTVVGDLRHDSAFLVVNSYENVKTDGNYCLQYRNNRPCIMHEWEWEYFKIFPRLFEQWLLTSPIECNHTIIQKMIENLS